jgi:UPF0271 protein
MKIGLNSDMGEGFGHYRIADDDGLMEVVSSANIACGFHAGDPQIMARMVQLAKARNVDIGVHAGFADMVAFGRRTIPLEPDEVVQQVLYQTGALQAIAAAQGCRLAHFSFHAAMGYMAAFDAVIADKVMRAIKVLDPTLLIYGMPDTEVERAATRLGFETVNLVFADRAYQDDGFLVSRKLPGAVLHDANDVIARVNQFMDDGTVTTVNNKRIKINATSFLVHSDTPGSAALAKLVHDTIVKGGGEVVPPSSMR